TRRPLLRRNPRATMRSLRAARTLLASRSSLLSSRALH
uniref:Uncharacterized protein n=1 Tax=Aegilops tauschii subsp. strangulata TaxID=200361 RepID=A0A453AFW4_AEGTS